MLYSAVLLTFVAFSFWLVYKNVFVHSVIEHDGNKPDMVIRHVNALFFDRMGMIKTTVQAQSLIHHKQTGLSVLSEPVITLHSHPGKNPWIITADRGEILHDNKLYQLFGNVRLTEAAGKHNRAMTITTSELFLYPGQHMAKTDKMIHFSEQKKNNRLFSMTSVGAKACQKTGIIKLYSQVRGRYVPNHQKA